MKCFLFFQVWQSVLGVQDDNSPTARGLRSISIIVQYPWQDTWVDTAVLLYYVNLCSKWKMAVKNLYFKHVTILGFPVGLLERKMI